MYHHMYHSMRTLELTPETYVMILYHLELTSESYEIKQSVFQQFLDCAPNSRSSLSQQEYNGSA
jgi:hypothetical protein